MALFLLHKTKVDYATYKKAATSVTRRGSRGAGSKSKREGEEEGELSDPGYASGGTTSSLVKKIKGLPGLGSASSSFAGSSTDRH